MILYLFSIGITLLVSSVAMKYDKDTTNRKICVVVLIVCLILISGFRVDNTLYSDEWNYRHMFEGYKGTTLSSIDWSLSKEPAFKLLMWILANRGFSSQSFIFVAAAFTLSVYIWFIYKQCYDFQFAMFLFVAGGGFFTTMNIIRQCIAIAIVLLGFSNVENKRFGRFFLFVLVASLFHLSAWIALLYYFFLNLKEIEKKLIPVSIIAIFVMANFSKLMAAMETTNYGHYVSNYNTSGYGTSWLRILFWGSFAAFIFFRRYNIFKNDEFSQPIINGYFLSTILLLAAKAYVYITRMDYTGICNYIMISQIPQAFSENSRKLAKLLLMVLFFVYGYYQTVLIGGYSNMSHLLFAFI